MSVDVTEWGNETARKPSIGCKGKALRNRDDAGGKEGKRGERERE